MAGTMERCADLIGSHGVNIHRAFVDGDFVVCHVHVKRHPADAGLAVVDIFRTDGTAILEHWDVLMEVPANPVNTNPLF